MKNSQKGFTLIEQLITLALGAVLMAGIATSISAITRAQNLTRDYGNLQETLNFVTATLVRSARTAEQVINITNAETSNQQLSFKHKVEKNLKNCLAEEPAVPYYETYSIKNNNLVCEVNEAESIKSEVIAFGVSKLSFKCAEYNPTSEVEYKECEEANLKNMIAIETELFLSANRFLKLDKDFEHVFILNLRDHFNDDCKGNEVCE